MNDQPKKLTLYSINDYLIDHLERRYAPPYSDRDYTCIRCGRAWDAKAAFAKKHWRVTPDGWIYGDDWTCSNCINPVVHFQDLLDAFPSRGSIQGIPLESGVHDCYWVLDRRCTNPEITRNNIPSAYSRDWESRIAGSTASTSAAGSSAGAGSSLIGTATTPPRVGMIAAFLTVYR
ncbi:hypothetical protein LCGC14_2021340, partial [marine sediment metagenome]